MLLTLDCEDGETAIRSLAAIFNCEQERFVDIMKSIDMDAIYNDLDGSPRIPPEEFLFYYVKKETCEPLYTDTICWFHLTRTLESSTFDDGILPLSASLELIWETLFEIFEDETIQRNLKHMQKYGVPDFQYNLKSNDPFHAGPYAILVKEVAFNPSALSQHNYLEIPEIIEDICNGYEDKFGSSIIGDVTSALSPCIVKFAVQSNASQGQIESALYYAYTHANDLPVSGASVTCYDAENTRISPEQIIEIEFVNEDQD